MSTHKCNEFETYQEYRDYVTEEWEWGHINELEIDELIISEKEFTNEDGLIQINYHFLTEEEFNKLKNE